MLCTRSGFYEDDGLIFFVHFVNGLPESRFLKAIFPESRFVKFTNPVSRSYLQSRISLPLSPKIPNPGRKISQIPDPVKPIGDPLLLLEQLSLHCVTYSAGTDCLKFLFLTMVPSLLRENLKSFVSTMELYIVLQQRTNHPPIVRLNVLSRF